MDRPTGNSDSFDPDSTARVSLGNLSNQADGNWHFAPMPTAGAPEGLGFVWAGLCTGELRIVRHVQEEFRTTVHLEERRADDPSHWAIRGRSLAVLQRILAGQSMNFIALDLALSSSTVSGEFQLAMRALELKPRLSGLPLFLPQLWQASRVRPTGASTIRSCWHGVRYATVSLPRPDLKLVTLLTRAELEVGMMLLDGKTHAEIADARGTSIRTIANQLASIFAKLKVSGRLELVTTLARGGTSWNNLPPSRPAASALLD